MAGTARRVNSRADQYRKYRTYEDGNAVRKLDVYPEEQENASERIRKRQVSRRIQENRRRARNLGPGYLVFLSAVCAATLFLCVHYLQLRSSYTEQLENVAVLESQLSQLKADNDAYYNQVQTSVNLNEIKQKAMTELGMHYAGESQIRYYSVKDNSYMRQYQDVPGIE